MGFSGGECSQMPVGAVLGVRQKGAVGTAGRTGRLPMGEHARSGVLDWRRYARWMSVRDQG